MSDPNLWAAQSLQGVRESTQRTTDMIDFDRVNQTLKPAPAN
jgi:hypothetical protein